MKSTNTKTPRGKFTLSVCRMQLKTHAPKQNKNSSKNSLLAQPGNSSGDIKISLKTQNYHTGCSLHEEISTNRTNIQAKVWFAMYLKDPPPSEVKVENITDEAQPLNHGFFTGWRNQKSETTHHKTQNSCSSPVRNWLLLQPPSKQTKTKQTTKRWEGSGEKKERIHTHSQKEPLAKCRLGLKDRK